MSTKNNKEKAADNNQRLQKTTLSSFPPVNDGEDAKSGSRPLFERTGLSHLRDTAPMAFVDGFQFAGVSAVPAVSDGRFPRIGRTFSAPPT